MASTHTNQIDKHSETWVAMTEWARSQRQEAVAALIADRLSEQQRGKIELLDKLLRLTETEAAPVIASDTYS